MGPCAKSGLTSHAPGLGGSFLSHCPEDSTGRSVAEGHIAIMQLFVRTGAVLLPLPCSISWLLIGTLPAMSECMLRPSMHSSNVFQHTYYIIGTLVRCRGCSSDNLPVCLLQIGPTLCSWERMPLSAM